MSMGDHDTGKSSGPVILQQTIDGSPESFTKITKEETSTCVADIDRVENDEAENRPLSGKTNKRRKNKMKDSVETLQPGEVINPEVNRSPKGASGYEKETSKGPDVRPKSGNRKGKPNKKGDLSTENSVSGDHGLPYKGPMKQDQRITIPASNSEPRNLYQKDYRGFRKNKSKESFSSEKNAKDSPRQKNDRPGSSRNPRQGEKGSGQYKQENQMQQIDQNKTPRRQDDQRPINRGPYQRQEYRQDGKGARNSNQQARGNSTPKDNQRGDNKRSSQTPKTQQNKKPAFESYWKAEALQRGLKSGELIQGQLRVNPKNYEESYIPHPDGVSDIFISGMKDRNRALNGDIVAVFLYERENWKIHVNSLKDLEEKHTEQEMPQADDNALSSVSGESPQVVFQLRPESDPQSRVYEESPQVISQLEPEEDPDVIIESEEIIDLTVGSNNDSQSANSKATTAELGNNDKSKLDSALSSKEQSSTNEIVAAAASNIVSSDRSQQNTVSCSSKNVQDITDELKNINLQGKNQGSGMKIDNKGKKHNDKDTKNSTPDNRGKNTPGSAQKKYSTLQEVLQDGSPVVKRLFTNDDKQKTDSAQRALQRTGKVVAIIERKHSRASTGHIALMNDKNPNKALFKPMDHRLPSIMVPMSDCPKDFLQRPEDHANTLFICRITEWPENSMYAHGELMRSLGEAGEIEPETEGILIENDVDYSEFSEQAINSLPVQELPWQIPEDEIAWRRDFREHCVFTIDPATARDLDDALSCEKLEDGTYNVGVHIADVSYFLKEDTALDKVARFRATSVYLIQKVIPMLPRILCEELCSLNPAQDRLTFSVVWNMSETGEIYGEWFGRTVIKSCVKLSYDHAQGFIEEPERVWSEDELPPISDNYPTSQIRDTVLNLHKIAKNLRKNRFDEGALRLDQVKITFTLDGETGMPNGYNVYRQRDSNRLVEEFMLLANMAVAHKIKRDFPETAFLRRHPPPQTKMMDDLVELCSNLGFPIDPQSAGTLQRSLWHYAGNDDLSAARMQVLVSMCSKPMQNAKYFCTGCLDDEELYRHYALNVPLYTHFTSPIRRYADVMVHRQLGAALGYCEASSRSSKIIQGIADNCNDRKTNSKRVSELSADLYFAVFVKTAGPFEERGMVMAVLDKAFDVFILKFGVVKRVYCDKLAIKDKLYTKEQRNPVLTLFWEPKSEGEQGLVQKISIFTLVNCILKPGELPLQWMAIIKPPRE